MQELLDALNRIVPLELAEDWDNVGLLLEPTVCDSTNLPRRIFLCIDLTEPVLEEALSRKADFLLVYHPPIFTPLTRLAQGDATSRILLRSARMGLPIYSPHTALDAVEGGVNDWLASGLGSGKISRLSTGDAEATENSGRRIILDDPIPLAELAQRVKQHLNLESLRLAPATDASAIQTIALCAGAGGSVLVGTLADCYLTGEMRHHDVLAANARGISVILCEHTNTERGYLSILADKLTGQINGIECLISRVDRDPLSRG